MLVKGATELSEATPVEADIVTQWRPFCQGVGVGSGFKATPRRRCFSKHCILPMNSIDFGIYHKP